MKKIIDGKIYNTETSTCLYSQDVYNNGNYCGSNNVEVTPRGNLMIVYTSNGQDLYRQDDLHAATTEEVRDWLNGREITEEEIAALAGYDILFDA